MDWDAYVKEGSQERIGVINHQKPDYLIEFWDLFSEKEFDQLTQRRPWDHTIELTPGFQPQNCKTKFMVYICLVPNEEEVQPSRKKGCKYVVSNHLNN